MPSHHLQRLDKLLALVNAGFSRIVSLSRSKKKKGYWIHSILLASAKLNTGVIQKETKYFGASAYYKPWH